MESTAVDFRQRQRKSAKVFLKVHDAHAEAWAEGEITEGAIGIEAQCEISGERWEGLTKKLIVSDGENGWPLMIADGKAMIPHEALKEGNILMLGVDGWDADGNLRIPTILAGACYVQKSVAGLKPMVPLPPSPDIVAQILAAAEKAMEIAADIERRADNHEFDGDDGYSPTVEIDETEDGYLLTVTDKDGEHRAEIKNGDDGISPTVTVTPIADGYQITITDAAGQHTAQLHNGSDYQLTEEDKEEIAGMVPGYDDTEIWNEVGKKMVKHILEYDGTHIKEDGENLTFAVLYEMLMEKPDFCVLVHNNYAYHPNGVSTSQIVFSSEYPVQGYDRAHRITMLANGTVTATETESEHTSSRVNAITEANEGSTVQYPSVKGVADYVRPIKEGLTQCENTKVGYSEVVNGQLLMYSDSTKEHLLATLDLPGGGVTDVIADGTSIVSDGVAHIPTIQEGVSAGIAKLNSSTYGIGATSDGIIYVNYASSTHITNRTNGMRPIGPTNLDYAVKAAMTDGKGAAWTAEERAAARERQGIYVMTQEEYDLLDNPQGIYIITEETT